MKRENGYSTDDEVWRKRERLEMNSQARKDVAAMARKMVEGKDKNRIASLLGVTRETLAAKIRDGRFTAPEFVVLSYLCGYEVKAEDKYQMMLEGVLE